MSYYTRWLWLQSRHPKTIERKKKVHYKSAPLFDCLHLRAAGMGDSLTVGFHLIEGALAFHLQKRSPSKMRRRRKSSTRGTMPSSFVMSSARHRPPSFGSTEGSKYRWKKTVRGRLKTLFPFHCSQVAKMSLHWALCKAVCKIYY